MMLGGVQQMQSLRCAISRLLLVASISPLANVDANAFSWSSAKEQRVLQLVREFEAALKVPSIAVSVTVNGNTVLAVVWMATVRQCREVGGRPLQHRLRYKAVHCCCCVGDDRRPRNRSEYQSAG